MKFKLQPLNQLDLTAAIAIFNFRKEVRSSIEIGSRPNAVGRSLYFSLFLCMRNLVVQLYTLEAYLSFVDWMGFVLWFTCR